MRGGATVDSESGQLLSNVPFLFKLRPNKYNFALRLAKTPSHISIFFCELNITQTCLCNILQYFTAVKMIIFR